MIPVTIPVAISIGVGRTKWEITSISSSAVVITAISIPIPPVMTDSSASFPVLDTAMMSVVVIPMMVMVSFNRRSHGQ